MGRSNQAKLYNYQRGQSMIEEARLLDHKPSLLLHSCCAPCNSAVLEMLMDVFDVTIFYNNHNIYPVDEFELRLSELRRFVSIYNDLHHETIQVIVPELHFDEYTQRLGKRSEDREGGLRCQMCLAMRLKETLDYAVNHQFDYVTTVMTISRCKNSIQINELAEKLMGHYPSLTYLYSDFKKKGGIDRSRELCAQYDLYTQEYCGCLYSFREYLKRPKKEAV